MRYNLVKTGPYYGILDLRLMVCAPHIYCTNEINRAEQQVAAWNTEDFGHPPPWVFGWAEVTLKDMINYYRTGEMSSNSIIYDNGTWLHFTKKEYHTRIESRGGNDNEIQSRSG